MSTDTLTNGAQRQDTRSSTVGPAQRAYDNATLIDPILACNFAGATVAASDSPADLKAVANYTCDGTADQVQINAAITAYGVVTILPGTYSLSATISVPNNRYMLLCPGANITLAASSNTTILANSDTSTGSNIKIEGQGVFNHNGANQSTETHGVFFDGVTGLDVSGLQVTGARGWDMRLENCSRFSIDRVTSYGPGGTNNRGGIQTFRDCARGSVSKSFTHSHTDGQGYGLWIMGEDIDVDACQSYGNDDDCLVVGNTQAGDARRVTFNGGSYSDSVSDGGCHVTTGAEDVTFNGTRFQGNDLIGIKVNGSNIKRVTLNGIVSEGNTTDGVTMGGSGETKLVNSRVENNGGRGVFMNSGTISELSVLGNSIRGNTDSNIEAHSSATISDVLIENNKIANSSDWGIDLNATRSEVMIIANYIEGNTSGGLDGGGSSSGVTTQMNWGAQKPADVDERA